MRTIYIVGGFWLLGAFLAWLWVHAAAVNRKRLEAHNPDYNE